MESKIHYTSNGTWIWPERIEYAVKLARILIFFIFFISSSALCAGALQSIGHFFIPTFGPILLNLCFILGILICIFYKLSVEYLAFFILIGGALQLILHLAGYFKNNFGFETPSKKSFKYLYQILSKFLPCLFSMSILEVNLLIDTALASYLPTGSVTLLNYGFDFARIAIGVFAVSLSTILLPHFSRIVAYAPKRLSFYLLEATKLVFWVTVPVTLLMSFFSYKIFYTIFFGGNFPIESVLQAKNILIAFLSGLFFFSLNKILLSMYYAIHQTFLPTIISLIGAISNTILNFILIKYWGTVGLALATSISAGIQSFLFILLLHKKFNFVLYGKQFLKFLYGFILQLIFVSLIFYLLFIATDNVILNYLPNTSLYIWITNFVSHILQKQINLSEFLINGFGFWLWTMTTILFNIFNLL